MAHLHAAHARPHGAHARDGRSAAQLTPRLAVALVAIVCLAATPAPATTRIGDIAYVADGADAHELDLFLPRDRSHAPIVVFVHGGAFMQGGRRDYDRIGQQLADQGFACAVVSYRLYPAATARVATEDVAQAVGWIVRRAADYGLDPADVFLAGHSAGGQIVALLATHPQYLADAGVPHGSVRGVVPLAGAYDLRDLSGEPDSWQRVDGHIFGETASARADISAGIGIDPATPPMLVGCGTDDDPDACTRASVFVDRLRAAKVEANVLHVTGADHMGLLYAFARDGDPVNAAFRHFVAAHDLDK